MKIGFISSPPLLTFTVPLINELSRRDELVLYLVSLGKKQGLYKLGEAPSESGTKDEALAGLSQRIEVVRVLLPSLTARNMKSWSIVWQMVADIRARRTNLCHTDVFLTQMLPLFWFRRFALVADVHDPFPHVGERQSRMLIPRLRLFLHLSDRVIIHNRIQAQRFTSFFSLPREKVCSVSLGVPDNLHAWDRSIVQEEKNTVLFFGRISPYKGLEHLAVAWESVLRRIPDARLIVAGEGRFYFDARPLMTHTSVELHHGYVSNAMLRQLLLRASIVVLPYVEATQSGVVLTAYAFHKPVVATTVGALPEVVDDNVTGLLVPPKDPVSLADAIVNLLSNPTKRAFFGKAIGEKVRREFSWPSIAEQTAGVYRSCLG